MSLLPSDSCDFFDHSRRQFAVNHTCDVLAIGCAKGPPQRGEFDVVGYVSRWQRNLRRTAGILEDTLHPAGVAVYFCDEEILSSCERHWDQLVDEAKNAERYSRRLSRRIREGYETNVPSNATQVDAHRLDCGAMPRGCWKSTRPQRRRCVVRTSSLPAGTRARGPDPAEPTSSSRADHPLLVTALLLATLHLRDEIEGVWRQCRRVPSLSMRT